MSPKQRWPWEAQGVISAHQEAQARRAHRTNRWLTIFLPLLLGSGGLLAFAAWSIVSASHGGVAQAARLITIYATLFCIASGLPILALFIGLIILTWRAQKGMPVLTRQALQALHATQSVLLQIADKSAEPFIRGHATLAAWRAAWRTLRKGGRP